MAKEIIVTFITDAPVTEATVGFAAKDMARILASATFGDRVHVDNVEVKDHAKRYLDSDVKDKAAQDKARDADDGVSDGVSNSDAKIKQFSVADPEAKAPAPEKRPAPSGDNAAREKAKPEPKAKPAAKPAPKK